MARSATGWRRRGWGMAVIVALGRTMGLPSSVRANELPSAEPTSAAKDVADMDLTELVTVRISPFDVSLALDKGYQPSNSVSASRLDSPIRDLPFAIQAFTESFIDDQQPRDIFDVARYSPGVTYRSNDFNEGNANLAIRGFAVSSVAGGNIAIMRDGFHGPTIFDFTNIARVEVVKGPSSFLYGQVAPGGIVNIITKSPQSTFAASADARYALTTSTDSTWTSPVPCAKGCSSGWPRLTTKTATIGSPTTPPAGTSLPPCFGNRRTGSASPSSTSTSSRTKRPSSCRSPGTARKWASCPRRPIPTCRAWMRPACRTTGTASTTPTTAGVRPTA